MRIGFRQFVDVCDIFFYYFRLEILLIRFVEEMNLYVV